MANSLPHSPPYPRDLRGYGRNPPPPTGPGASRSSSC